MEADGAVIQLVTRCNSEEEFIERFARFTTETAIVVPALPHVSPGTDGHFVICLKDRSVMMKGRCEVTEIRPVAVAPGAAPRSGPALMRLRLRGMDAHSAGIHLRLMERHASSSRPVAVPQAVPTAVPALDISAVTVVGETRVPSDTEPTVISPAPRPETRAPGAAFTLPANPLSELDAADLASFVELTLDPDHVAPAAPAARPDRARRITRRLVPYALCIVGGLLVGSTLRPASKAAPAVVAPDIVVAPDAPVPPPVTTPPSTAPAPEDESPAADVPPTINTDPAPAAVVADRSVSKPHKRRAGSARRTRDR